MVSKQKTKQKQMGSTDIQMLDSYLSLLSKLYGIDFNTASSKLPFLIQQLWHITKAWQCYLKGDKKLVSVVISNTCQSQHVFAFHSSCLLINLESAEQEERIYPPILAPAQSPFLSSAISGIRLMTSSIQKQTILKSVWSNKATRELPLLSRTRAPIMAVQNEIDGIALEGFFCCVIETQFCTCRLKYRHRTVGSTQYHIWIRSHFSRL